MVNDAVKVLLQHGADADACSFEQQHGTPLVTNGLQFSAGHGSWRTMKLLFDHGQRWRQALALLKDQLSTMQRCTTSQSVCSVFLSIAVQTSTVSMGQALQLCTML